MKRLIARWIISAIQPQIDVIRKEIEDKVNIERSKGMRLAIDVEERFRTLERRIDSTATGAGLSQGQTIERLNKAESELDEIDAKYKALNDDVAALRRAIYPE